jgi:hypothetical protein
MGRKQNALIDADRIVMAEPCGDCSEAVPA